MKTIIKCFLLLSLMLCLLTGCGKPADVNETNATIDDAAEGKPLISFHYETDDRSYYDETEVLRMDCHYKRVVMDGESDAVTVINQQLKDVSDQFMANIPDVATMGYPFDNDEQHFMNYKDCEVSYFQNGIISIKESQNWWLGGVNNRGMNGLHFNYDTGEKLTMADILHEDPTQLETRIKDLVWQKLCEKYGEDYMYENAKEIVYELPFDDMHFIIEEDEIVIYFEWYQIADGASGLLYVNTDIFI